MPQSFGGISPGSCLVCFQEELSQQRWFGFRAERVQEVGKDRGRSLPSWKSAGGAVIGELKWKQQLLWEFKTYFAIKRKGASIPGPSPSFTVVI